MKKLGNSEIIVQGVVLGAWAMGGWYWGGLMIMPPYQVFMLLWMRGFQV